jgi:hypothetical protein
MAVLAADCTFLNNPSTRAVAARGPGLPASPTRVEVDHQSAMSASL